MLAVLFSIVCFSILDYFWIKGVMLPLYQEGLSEILLIDINGQLIIRTFPALWAYALLISALWYFVIHPHQNDGTFVIVKQGFVLGLFLYGTYALTCWTLFKGFTATLVISDILWGGTIYALTSVLTCKFIHFLSS